MKNIQYISHLLLNHKNRIIIHLFILSLMYLSFYSPKMVLCMMEDGYTPDIAESKSATKEVPDLIKNIQAFAGSRATLIEEKDQLIKELKEQIIRLENEKKNIAINSALEYARDPELKEHIDAHFREQLKEKLNRNLSKMTGNVKKAYAPLINPEINPFEHNIRMFGMIWDDLKEFQRDTIRIAKEWGTVTQVLGQSNLNNREDQTPVDLYQYLRNCNIS